MKIIAEIKQPYSSNQRTNFIVKYNHQLGYEIRENEDEGKREYHYTLESIKRVLDVSAVDIPAYDATEISARRLFDAESKEHEAESRNAASVARAKFKFQEELRRK